MEHIGQIAAPTMVTAKDINDPRRFQLIYKPNFQKQDIELPLGRRGSTWMNGGRGRQSGTTYVHLRIFMRNYSVHLRASLASDRWTEL